MPFIEVTGVRPTEGDPDEFKAYTETAELAGPARVIFRDVAGGYHNIELAKTGTSKVELHDEEPAEPVKSGKKSED